MNGKEAWYSLAGPHWYKEWKRAISTQRELSAQAKTRTVLPLVLHEDYDVWMPGTAMATNVLKLFPPTVIARLAEHGKAPEYELYKQFSNFIAKEKWLRGVYLRVSGTVKGNPERK